MDIRDIFAAASAEQEEASLELKGMYDSWIRAGFTPKQALELTKTVISSGIAAHNEVLFAERMARGEFEQ